ncbi:flagellar hook-associated protein FlgK [Roseicella aquatilis]|nr:flagellar basal body rod C-terminal domain-containing protein [Roseicella aquatilis]
MSLDSALLIASSGLRLTSAQMAQASQNVANAGTAGYSAKHVLGEAVEEAGVRGLEPSRNVDETLRAEARNAHADAAAADLRASVLSPLAQLQGDPSSGTSLGGLIGALRDGFTALQASPAEGGAQATALNAAAAVAGQLNDLTSAVTRARQGVQDGLQSDVDQANGLLRTIAQLDAGVRAASAAGRSNADALDRRDAAIAGLAELMDVRPIAAEGGGVTLILRGGAVLPLDAEASPLSIGSANASPGAYYGPPGGTLPGIMLNRVDITASLGSNGRLGAAVELRDETLPLMQSELDLTAATLAQRMDQQGLRLFTDGGDAPPDPTVSGYGGAVIGYAGRIAVNPEVEASPRLLRDGTQATASFTPNPATGPSGFTTLLDNVLQYGFGTGPAAGTSYAAIPTSGLGPNTKLNSRFSAPTGIVDYAMAATASQSQAATAAEAQRDHTAAASAQLDALVQKREGVNVDQEMASLVQLQNAYAANARVMSVVQSMWDALIGMVH